MKLLLNEKDSKLRVATFVTCIGPDALDIHNGLPFQNDEEKGDMNKILELWNSYCIGETNIIYERYKFNNRNQDLNESIDTYASALRALASTCDFGELKDQLIRDRIVCGRQNNAVRRKLLQEPKLTLGRCLDVCRAAEATSAQIKAMAGHANPSSDEVNLLRKGKRRSVPVKKPTKGSTIKHDLISDCKFCGRQHEKRKEKCYTYGKSCSNCGKLNRFKEKCLGKNANVKKKVHQVVLEEDLSDTSEEELLSVDLDNEHVLSVNAIDSAYQTKIFVTMEIEGKPVKMQTDSGASCNVMPEKFVPKRTEIKGTNQTLLLYDKSSIPVAGICKIHFRNPKNNKKYRGDFVVVKGNCIPLLGSRASQQMKLIEVHYENIMILEDQLTVDNSQAHSEVNIDDKAVNDQTLKSDSVNKTDPQMRSKADQGLTKEFILTEYADVFEGLGKMEGKLHFEVDETVQPSVMPPRRVPIAVKGKLKSELQRLEDKGVIKKITEPTDWVSSLVVTEKANGNVRVCIDPQQLNKALKRSHYPLPVIEDVLPDLSDAKVFSKADLKDGFLQIELDEESSKLTTFQSPWGRYRWLRLPFGVSLAPEYFQMKFHQNLEIWLSEQEQAFEKIKQAVTAAPVLKYFNPKELTEGLGFVLLQNGQPVTYNSRALTLAEQNYSQIEKELLAQVYGLEHNHQYVFGRKVILWTDHKPLISISTKPLSSAPKRLQRLLLRMQHYDVEIHYKPGSQMYLADTLSRAYLKNEARSPVEQEVETIHMMNFLPISEPQLREIQEATQCDPTLQALKKVILDGWPDLKDNLPSELHPYFSFRDELAAQDGIIFKGLRCIIPATLRQKIREKLHSTHIGVQGCLRRARELVYWPAMNSDITDYLSKCEVCNTFQPQQQKEPLISHEIPHRPWEKIASDIFTFDSKDYLCTVDYYSNYFELDRLYDKTAPEVVKKLKRHFSNHGIPDKLHSDNMPFGSREFQDFSKEYEFEHLTSSPDYPQSNGKVENAIKTAKSLMKKARESGQDFYLSLLAWRNTPTEGMGSSPAQLLFSRHTKTSLPTASDFWNQNQ